MMARAVIVGGGLSGLVAAHRLHELARAQGLPLQVTILEARPRFGGLITTEEREGFLLEGGADAFLCEPPAARALCERLGLGGELMETRPGFRRSFIVRRGRLVAVPSGWHLIAPEHLGAIWRMPLLSWSGKLRVACEPWVTSRSDGSDESVGQFVRRRFGLEAFERVAQPMVSGIYGADPDQLSVLSTAPRFRDLEQRCGSVLRGLRADRLGAEARREASGPRYGLFLTLRRGLGTLVDALLQRMPDVALRCGAPVARVERGSVSPPSRDLSAVSSTAQAGGGGRPAVPTGRPAWSVVLRGGEALQADALCLALPSPEAAALLRDTTSLFAPSHWKAELANVVWKAVTLGRLDAERIGPILDAAESLAIQTVEVAELWRGAVARAVATRHPAYDTLFVELALRERAPLASYDATLRRRFPDVVVTPTELLRAKT